MAGSTTICSEGETSTSCLSSCILLDRTIEGTWVVPFNELCIPIGLWGLEWDINIGGILECWTVYSAFIDIITSNMFITFCSSLAILTRCKSTVVTNSIALIQSQFHEEVNMVSLQDLTFCNQVGSRYLEIGVITWVWWTSVNLCFHCIIYTLDLVVLC